MDLPFKVHRAHDTKVGRVFTTHEGTIQADVNAFEVELVSSLDACGTWTGRFFGNAANEAKMLFKEGETVVLKAYQSVQKDVENVVHAVETDVQSVLHKL